MSDYHFALFETAIGACALIWSGRGVAGVQLPEKNKDATRARVLRRFAGAREETPPATMQQRDRWHGRAACR